MQTGSSRRWLLSLTLSLLLAATLAPVAAWQVTGVTAEAIGQANLRAWTDVNSTLLGQIQAGTRYPVIGRSEFYPWVLLGDPATLRPIGWVYNDLVAIQGDLNRVPFATQEVGGSTSLTSPTPANIASTPTLAPHQTPAPTLASGVTGLVLGEINIRYGPGVDYPRIGIGREGERYAITATHTQFPWVQIAYPAAPNGYGWVQVDLLEIQGDLRSLPTTSQTIFALPTLTPTPPAVHVSALPGTTPVPVSAAFQALGNQLWQMVLDAGFDLETSKPGALFLLDLQTGEAVTFGDDIAFSGMSLSKIVILADLYRTLDGPPDLEGAMDIGNSMVCSENTASNALLRTIGEGDPYRGAQSVTEFMQELGFKNTFIVAPYEIAGVTTPQPVVPPVTEANQASAEPDPTNQMTVAEMGWLLNDIYQCAYEETSLLLSTFPDQYTPQECRQMVNVMSTNNLGRPLLLSAGVPEDIRVAHKHGWIEDTHGGAGIVFTPGGDYVLVVVLHNPEWLDFGISFPLITEISRTVYNHYNPEQAMEQPREPVIVETSECNLLGNPVIEDLMSYSLDEP